MKKFSLCLFLLAISLYLVSDGLVKTSHPQYNREQAEAKVAQFKRETGLKGQAEYDPEHDVFFNISGEFPNISVRDTISARIAAESICDLMLPFLKAKREQLIIVRNYQNMMGFKVSFNQEINGYKIEPHAGMGINFRTKNFYLTEVRSSIIPNLNVQTDNLISLAEAESIFNKELRGKQIRRFDSKILITRYWSEETQDSYYPESYKTCWILNYEYNSNSFGMYIDAVTGKLLRIRKYIPFD